MMKKVLVAAVLALILVLPAFSQETSGFSLEPLPDETEAAYEIFAPFVSQLEAEVRNNLIRLSWQDSKDIRGPVYVYRSETPFSGPASLPVPVEVPYGTGSWLEEAEKSGTVYYFVAASDDWGRKYILTLPYTNTTAVTVSAENLPGYPLRSLAPGRTGTDAGSETAVRAGPLGAGGIEGITARIEEDRVIITFSGSGRTGNLILYRSLSPIRRMEDLLQAVIVRQQVSSPVIDYPLPGITYYYALIYEDDLGTGLVNIQAGRNTTGGIELPHNAPPLSRGLPLPGINLSGTAALPPAGQDSPVNTAVSAGASAAGNTEASGRAAPKQRPSRERAFFPEDLEKGGAGEAYQLRSIVQGYFVLGEWEKAGEELRRFLELPRSDAGRIRAHFYLGQTYYFQGQNREALFEFLSVRERYPSETNPWIQAVLGNLTAR